MSLGEIITFEGRRCTKVKRDGSLTSSPVSVPSSTLSTSFLSSTVPESDTSSGDTTMVTSQTPDNMEEPSIGPTTAEPTSSGVITMPPQPMAESKNEDMGRGMKIPIIAATVASVAAVIIMVLIFFFIRRRNRRQAEARNMNRQVGPTEKSSHTRTRSEPISLCDSRYSTSTTSDPGLVGISGGFGNQSTRKLVKTPRPVLRVTNPDISIDTTLLESPNPTDDTVSTPQSKRQFSRHFNLRGKLNTLQKLPSRNPSDMSVASSARGSHRRIYSVNSIIPSPSLHFSSDLHLPKSPNDHLPSPLSIQQTSNSENTADNNRSPSSVVLLPGGISNSGSTKSTHPPLRLTASDLSRWRRSRRKPKRRGSFASRKSDPFDLEGSISTPTDHGGRHDDDADDDDTGYEQRDNDGHYFSDDTDRERDEAVPYPNGVEVAVAVSLSRPRHGPGLSV